MTQIDDILELVRTGAIIPETYTAILAREVERLRGVIEGGLPPLTGDDELEAFNGHRDPTREEIEAFRIGYALAGDRFPV